MLLVKLPKLPFSSSAFKVDVLFDLIYNDLWDPLPISFRLGYRYFILFIYQHTSFTWIYFLYAKFEHIDKYSQIVYHYDRNTISKNDQNVLF